MHSTWSTTRSDQREKQRKKDYRDCKERNDQDDSPRIHCTAVPTCRDCPYSLPVTSHDSPLFLHCPLHLFFSLSLSLSGYSEHPSVTVLFEQGFTDHRIDDGADATGAIRIALFKCLPGKIALRQQLSEEGAPVPAS